MSAATSTIFVGTGRRKTSTARVRISEGSGKLSCNGREFEDYFSHENFAKQAYAPLLTVDLREKIDVTVNVVGLGLKPADRRRIRRLAGLGGGSYFDAQGAGALDDALQTAVSAPFEVYDESGALVARGSVNGPAVALPPGLYRVVVLTDPERVFEDVFVEEGVPSTLEVRP